MMSSKGQQQHTGILTIHDKVTNDLVPVRAVIRERELLLQRQEGIGIGDGQQPRRTGKHGPTSPSSAFAGLATNPEAKAVEKGPQRTVNLRPQGPSGPGLSIMGGSEHDMPIVISKIFPGHAADRNGDIHEGDLIVEINGVNVESAKHQEAVNLLKSDIVKLVLCKYTPVSRGSSSSIRNPSHHGGSFHASRSITGSRPLRNVSEEVTSGQGAPSPEASKWMTFQTIPLRQACVSRRMSGTDKLQPSSFHIVTADGRASPVLYCAEDSDVAQWCALLRSRIEVLDRALIVDTNGSLPEAEKISHFGWVAERQQSTEQWRNYVQRYMLLTGKRIQLFQLPPTSSVELSRPVASYPLLSTHCTDVQRDKLQDSWAHCFCLTPDDGQSLYMATESRLEMVTWLQHIRRSTVNQALDESCTFAGTYSRNRVELSVSLQDQLTLVDSFDKSVIWRKSFAELLATSCNDNSVVFSFALSTTPGEDGDVAGETDDYEIFFPSHHRVLHTVHNMLLAAVATLDPSIIKDPETA